MSDGNGDPLHPLAPRASTEDVHRSAARLFAAPYANDILEAFPGPALILNTTRQVVGANEAALSAFKADGLRQLLGARPGEVAGCSVAAKAAGGCGTGVECQYCGILNAILRSLDAQGRARGEGMLSLIDGSTLNVDVAVNCLEIEGESMLFLGFRDISAEKHREFMQGAFLHDLMNTAGGLKGLLDLSHDEPTSASELLPTLQGLVGSLVDEIEGQRHVMNAEQGRLQSDPQRVDPDQIVGQIVTLYRAHPVARGKEIGFEPNAATSIVTDVVLFRRVVGNMIKNALEATPEGGRVTVATGSETSTVHVDVHNAAVIPPAARAHVFKRGFSTKGRGRGTGTHAMRILTDQYLEGAVEFETREGYGTRFRVTLPRRPTGWQDAPEAPVEAVESLEGTRVLVADDDPINRRIAAHLFSKRGAQVETVNSGEGALEALAAADYDLVLMDVEMPGLGGLEVASKIGESGGPKPMVVMLSGHQPPASNQVGYDLWVAKPLRDRDLNRVAHERGRSSGGRPRT